MIITPPKGSKVPVCGHTFARAALAHFLRARALFLLGQVGVPFHLKVPGDSFEPIHVRDFILRITPGTGALTYVDEEGETELCKCEPRVLSLREARSNHTRSRVLAKQTRSS